LALLDVGLPDLSGYELLDALRTRHGHQPPYLVALTGWHEAHRDAVGGGFNHCLLKPATQAQLVAVIALAEAHSSATAPRQQADASLLPEGPRTLLK
jgi:CheY-like chemotaxis protein